MKTDFQSKIKAEFEADKKAVLQSSSRTFKKKETVPTMLGDATSELMDAALIKMHLCGGVLVQHSWLKTQYNNPCFVHPDEAEGQSPTFVAQMNTLKALRRRGLIEVSRHFINGNPQRVALTASGETEARKILKEESKTQPDKIMEKTPGQLAYEAYCETTGWKSAISGAPLPQWSEVKPEIVKGWENAAAATRRPLAIKLYKAREAVARLCVTYRKELLGNWYEATTEQAGITHDEIGFVNGPYYNGCLDSHSGQQELQRIIEGKD